MTKIEHTIVQYDGSARTQYGMYYLIDNIILLLKEEISLNVWDMNAVPTCE